MSAYTDPLPLRTTVAWGAFADVRVIPQRYGDTAGELIPYDAGRRVFVWADHASALVRAVTVDGQPVLGWQWRNGQDSTGRGVTFVDFTQAVDAGARPVAAGIGKLSSVRGTPLENPADVVLDVLAGIAGLPVTDGDLADFRAACDAQGLRVGGSIEDAGTAQAIVAQLCASVGAVFSPDAAGLCHLWPQPFGAAGVTVAAVDGRTTVTSTALLDDLATVLVLNFDALAGELRQSVEVAAPDAVADFGRRERVVEAPWITDPRVALAVAERLLRGAARRTWSVTAAAVPGRIRCGQWVEVQHPLAPASGPALVLAAAHDLNTRRTRLTVRMPADPVPRVQLVRQSAQTPADTYAAATVDTQGDQRVLTLTDATGKPLANARAVLDGQWARFSDAAGRVTFPASIMPRGSHTIEVEANGSRLVFTVLVP